PAVHADGVDARLFSASFARSALTVVASKGGVTRMDDFRALLACPVCAGPLAPDWSCHGCGARFDAPDGIPNLRLPGDARTDAVRRFYQGAPFPGYPPRDTLAALHARAERSAFARLLDRAVPGDARIAEIGCGTGQMCL